MSNRENIVQFGSAQIAFTFDAVVVWLEASAMPKFAKSDGADPLRICVLSLVAAGTKSFRQR
jgi:hypothetical protein